MSVFSRNHDYRIDILELKKCFEKYHLEMQLVWLVELLIYYTFLSIDNPETSNDIAINKEGRYVLSFRIVHRYVHDKSLSISCYTLLSKFRNLYVHSGSASAFGQFKELVTQHKDELIALAEHVGVKLNFGISLYKTIEHKVI